MIVYENAPSPVVRAAELEVAGRRIAARAIACSGEVGAPAFRFDPIGRRFVPRRGSGVVFAGSSDPQEWADAFGKAPPGPVLVEGAAREAEAIRGTFAAAAEGARQARCGVYMLDAPTAGLPAPPRGEAPVIPSPFVLLWPWSPDTAALDASLSAVAAAASRGIPAGFVWPALPGWPECVDAAGAWLARARSAGATFATPLPPAADVESRRAALEARQLYDPDAAEAYFDTLFHSPWEAALPSALTRAREAAREAGLEPWPPRPAAEGQPPANRSAAARLEELAAVSGDEHRSARLLAAVRWVDACGRDLGAIRREGNLARAFPLGSELVSDLERALDDTAGAAR